MPDLNRPNVDVWKRRFRRLYTANLAGLKTLSDTIAGEAGEMVTFTTTSEDGESAGAVVTGNKLEMLAAAEELITELDTANAPPVRSRVIIPDFSRCTPV